jgi:large subunit ribosomal protein L15
MIKLPAIVRRGSKRLGQGYGSGKGGHTSGRGMKGQKARDEVYLLYEGAKAKKSLIKRLPMLRGRGKFKPWGIKYKILSFADLTGWPAKTEVTKENLIKKGLVEENEKREIKILAKGELSQALVFKVKASKSAIELIEKTGGKVA